MLVFPFCAAAGYPPPDIEERSVLGLYDGAASYALESACVSKFEAELGTDEIRGEKQPRETNAKEGKRSENAEMRDCSFECRSGTYFWEGHTNGENRVATRARCIRKPMESLYTKGQVQSPERVA